MKKRNKWSFVLVYEFPSHRFGSLCQLSTNRAIHTLETLF
jgi:hypothetical protein